MSWDPDVYMKFANERTRPAMELLARVPLTAPKRVIDLGCGPGNSTALLATQWPNAEIEGLESSPEMLAKARDSCVRATWTLGEVEGWSPAAPHDVVFSNAALQWMTRPADVVAGVRRALRPGGRFVGEFGGFGNIAAIVDLRGSTVILRRGGR